LIHKRGMVLLPHQYLSAMSRVFELLAHLSPKTMPPAHRYLRDGHWSPEEIDLLLTSFIIRHRVHRPLHPTTTLRLSQADSYPNAAALQRDSRHLFGPLSRLRVSNDFHPPLRRSTNNVTINSALTARVAGARRQPDARIADDWLGHATEEGLQEPDRGRRTSPCLRRRHRDDRLPCQRRESLKKVFQ
jgi:hypothetical protein